MAPPQAKAKKEQILKKYHNCGIIIETKTFVSDVPMTDCFYVTDTICISLPSSSSSDDDDDDDDETDKERFKLILNIRFDIVFVKSTYFRSLIYRTTKNEMQQFMMNFTEYIIAKLAVLPSSLKGTSTTNKATTNETDSTSTAAIISPITTKEIISSSSPSSNQPARGVASSSKIVATITTNDNNNSNNWTWWWKILSFILLILIAKLQIQILNEIKSIRIEIQQQREQQQQQVREQCKLNNIE